METQARHVLVGGFVLAILASILIAVVWVAGVEPGRKPALFDIFFSGSCSEPIFAPAFGIYGSGTLNVSP